MVSDNPRIIFRLGAEKNQRLRLVLIDYHIGVQHACEAFVDQLIDFHGSDGPCITINDILARAYVLKRETSEVAHK
jgi:hypothetical protein